MGHTTLPAEASEDEAALPGVRPLAPDQPTMELVRSIMGPVFADERILKDAHNAKYDTKVLRRAEMPVSGLGYDTMLAAYLAGETSIGLKGPGVHQAWRADDSYH